MHNYLRAIGFSDIHRNDIDEIINEVIYNSDRYSNAISSEGSEIVEHMKEFGYAFGISVCGEYTDEGKFRVEYYYPYFLGKGITTDEKAEIEKHSEKESYAGICDEIKVGVSLIFYLQNMTEYLNARYIGAAANHGLNITLSALSLEGKIILPISKNEKQIEKKNQYTQKRSHLIAAARDGDEEAIENLTLDDMDMYTLLSKRILTESILEIVDTSFMPYGIESDQYSIIGEIIDMKICKNIRSGEEVIILTLDCNQLIFDLCINRKDLLGEPAIGRRFKGNIWMQGRINYSMLYE